MGALIKLVFGIVLIALGGSLISSWWGDFISVLRGAVPAFLVFIGVLVVWIEWEELRTKPEAPRPKKKK